MRICCLCFLLMGCVSLPPKNTENVCSVFQEKQQWFSDVVDVYNKWGLPIPVLMAIMHQESHFVADAKPDRTWILGIIPWSRPSSAYGYAQAVDDTWDNYLDNAGDWGADRDDFADAADFIGWYCHTSHKRFGISKTDTKNLYLAYHEGHDGYKHNSYLHKRELLQIANNVAKKAKMFQKQLAVCRIKK